MIVDTDVLIWYLRGHSKARDAIESQTRLNVSVVSYIELLQGLRNAREFKEIKKGFQVLDLRLLYISEEISAKAMFYVERHALSHRMELADALISATATVHGETLLTANDRHYRMIKELAIERFRP